MALNDDTTLGRAQGWKTLSTLHDSIEAALEPALQEKHDLSLIEFTVLEALSRQVGWHMRIQQLVRATNLSASATTRLVTRLENRGLLNRFLCPEDRRGIYTQLSEDGSTLLAQASPTFNEVLETAMSQAEENPELAPLIQALLKARG
jgi:DNA-binding MarR family transcriptional regulator